MDKKIELAKSWFVLAQISIILAGFFFATAGIAFTNAQNTLNFGINLVSELTNKNCENLNNKTIEWVNASSEYIGGSVISNLDFWKTSLEIGGLFAFFSFLFWGYGKYKLTKIKEENE